MTEFKVTLNLPARVYEGLREQAAATGHSIEDEIIAVLTGYATLPPELEAAIASLPQLSDDELWKAARSRVPKEDSDRTEELNHKRPGGKVERG